MLHVMHAEALSEKDFIYDNFHTVVEERLYRSGQIPSVRLAAYLEKYNIKTIINLCGKSKSEEAVAAQYGAKVLHAPMSANAASSKEQLEKLLACFDIAQEPILVHCLQGINRTGEAVALWLLDKKGASKELALEQFASKFGYNYTSQPEKLQLIKAWQGRTWLREEYQSSLLK